MKRIAEPGARVGAAYRLERLLGRGGMASVWAAVDDRSDARVAIKLLRDDLNATPEMRRRMRREARVSASIDHPNVVPIHEVIEVDDGSLALVMDLLEGETLAQRLHREHILPFDVVVNIMLPVVSAVGKAHAQGIVHRDLKPENIFLVGGSEPKVLDFGIAKLVGLGASAATAASTATGVLLGTPFYMSPEQVFGEGDVDHRADIWAIGLILYESISGVLPTRAEQVGQVLKMILARPFYSLSDAAPDVPMDVAELVDRMLARARDERPADLRDVAAVLEGHANGTARTPPIPPPTYAPQRDSPIDPAPPSSPPWSDAQPSAEPPPRRSLAWPIALAAVTSVVMVTLARRGEDTAPVAALHWNLAFVDDLAVEAAPPPDIVASAGSQSPIAEPPPQTTAAPAVAVSSVMAPVMASAARPPPTAEPPTRAEVLNRRK